MVYDSASLERVSVFDDAPFMTTVLKAARQPRMTSRFCFLPLYTEERPSKVSRKLTSQNMSSRLNDRAPPVGETYDICIVLRITLQEFVVRFVSHRDGRSEQASSANKITADRCPRSSGGQLPQLRWCAADFFVGWCVNNQRSMASVNAANFKRALRRSLRLGFLEVIAMNLRCLSPKSTWRDVKRRWWLSQYRDTLNPLALLCYYCVCSRRSITEHLKSIVNRISPLRQDDLKLHKHHNNLCDVDLVDMFMQTRCMPALVSANVY